MQCQGERGGTHGHSSTVALATVFSRPDTERYHKGKMERLLAAPDQRIPQLPCEQDSTSRDAYDQRRKKSAWRATGSAFWLSAANWRSLSGVKSRANCTFSSNWPIVSQPMITVLTGCEST